MRLNATIVEKKIILKFLAIINEFLLMTVVVLITHAYCISYYSTLAPECLRRKAQNLP